jgi:hypothetical protein
MKIIIIIITKLLEKIFMETEEGSLPCSQDPPLFLTLSQVNPVHDFITYFFKTILI